jgi:hypothetical protein
MIHFVSFRCPSPYQEGCTWAGYFQSQMLLPATETSLINPEFRVWLGIWKHKLKWVIYYWGKCQLSFRSCMAKNNNCKHETHHKPILRTGPEAIPMRMLIVPRLGSSSLATVPWAASIASWANSASLAAWESACMFKCVHQWVEVMPFEKWNERKCFHFQKEAEKRDTGICMGSQEERGWIVISRQQGDR